MVKNYSFEPCKHVLLEGLHVLPFSLCGFPPTLQPQASVRRLETLSLLFLSPLTIDWQLKDKDSYQPQPTREEGVENESLLGLELLRVKSKL